MIQLNADLAESFGGYQCDDAAIMPYLDRANIACGFHAGSPKTILSTLKLAKKHQVIVGAHPGYADLVNFGRISVTNPQPQLVADLLYQVSAVAGIAKAINHPIHYIKAHGALYHDIDLQPTTRAYFIEMLSLLPEKWAIILPAHCSIECRNDFNKLANPLIFEAFADRHYSDQGHLIPRTQPNALLTHEETRQRIKDFLQTGHFFSQHKQPLQLNFDTLCIHGDTPDAVNIAKSIHQLLKRPHENQPT